MRNPSSSFTVVMLLGMTVHAQLTAATPDQAYHRTPICADGNCAPNRATNGYHATRWRPWPGGEISLNKPIPPVGIELRKTEEPSRDKELELPARPMAPVEGSSTEPSPNDRSSGGLVLPPEFRDVTPRKPAEEPLPGNSRLQQGPAFPIAKPTPNEEPLLIGKKPIPLRNTPVEAAPALLKIRPASNSQSGLMPEMVPWSDEEKNPIVRQAVRISGNQVQQTISLDEVTLPEANDAPPLTIRVNHERSQGLPNQPVAIATVQFEATQTSNLKMGARANAPELRSAIANAPAILPNIEAHPLPTPLKMEPVSSGNAVVSPLRGVSQGNPLRP